MLCLHDSIRDDDPNRQRLLRTVEDAPSLPALILAAWQVARVLAVHLVEAVLAERARRPTAWPPCPACGVPLQRKGFAPRQMMSLYGPIRWSRRVGRCPKGCGIPQVAPLDVALGVQPHQRSSDEVQSLGGALAVFAPFATAARLLGWSSGGTVSPRAVWGWVQAAGQRAMAPLHTQLQGLDQGHLPPEEPLADDLAAAPLLIGADGVMVPFRPEGGHPQGKTAWHEVKVGVLARVGEHRTRTSQVVARLHQRRLVAVCGDLEALKARLGLEAVRQGMLHAPRVVWLSDGARGLWHLFEARFAGHATGILDFYHAAQQLWKGAAAWLDGRTTQARRWFGWARHRQVGEGVPATARETLRTVYAYLERHREHINYAMYKELGLPLGSGMVESACTWLIQQRFKGVGMRWSEDGFNHLLHRRLAWVNGRFDALFVLAQSPNS